MIQKDREERQKELDELRLKIHEEMEEITKEKYEKKL